MKKFIKIYNQIVIPMLIICIMINLLLAVAAILTKNYQSIAYAVITASICLLALYLKLIRL